ncbi:hypothetical protein BDQ12DRAFT_127973 [Crucibulum laeve]|uniref:Protein kinase domain-containing protein n=1 Tax=Crucibulum laeve TaxID=68775 RepID=A0A5C3M1U2_9AGAR|nr:hypothetical protein BDQ12DRAFT_127973 [Crucibulum laeve]
MYTAYNRMPAAPAPAPSKRHPLANAVGATVNHHHQLAQQQQMPGQYNTPPKHQVRQVVKPQIEQQPQQQHRRQQDGQKQEAPKAPSSPPLPRQNSKTTPPSPPKIITDKSGRVQFQRVGFLGEGGFARVYEVKDHRGTRQACKVVTKDSLKTKKAKTKVCMLCLFFTSSHFIIYSASHFRFFSLHSFHISLQLLPYQRPRVHPTNFTWKMLINNVKS